LEQQIRKRPPAPLLNNLMKSQNGEKKEEEAPPEMGSGIA